MTHLYVSSEVITACSVVLYMRIVVCQRSSLHVLLNWHTFYDPVLCHNKGDNGAEGYSEMTEQFFLFCILPLRAFPFQLDSFVVEFEARARPRQKNMRWDTLLQVYRRWIYVKKEKKVKDKKKKAKGMKPFISLFSVSHGWAAGKFLGFFSTLEKIWQNTTEKRERETWGYKRIRTRSPYCFFFYFFVFHTAFSSLFVKRWIWSQDFSCIHILFTPATSPLDQVHKNFLQILALFLCSAWK